MNLYSKEKCILCGKKGENIFPARYKDDLNVAGQKVKGVKIKASIFQCNSCNVRHVFPTIKPEYLEKLYTESEVGIWESNGNVCITRGYCERIKKIEKYAEGRKVLDVGCYTGGFLNCFSNKWSKYGIELSKKASSFARKRGVTIVGSKFPLEHAENNKFDVVTSLNVFEHIENPREYLNEMRSCLRDNGVLFIETGDFNAFFPKVMGSCWSYYHIPEHVVFYSKQGMLKLIQESGFKVLEIKVGLWHREPLSLKQKIKHIYIVARVIMQKVFFNLFTLKDKEKYTSSPVTWMTHKDHMYIIAQKVS